MMENYQHQHAGRNCPSLEDGERDRQEMQDPPWTSDYSEVLAHAVGRNATIENDLQDLGIRNTKDSPKLDIGGGT